MKIHDKTGFTLIELLVVMVIIAFTVIITYVNLPGVKARGRDIQTLKEVQSMREALANYKQDNGFYPSILTPGMSMVGPSGKVYLSAVPSNTDMEDACGVTDFGYASSNPYEYSINYCLTNPIERVGSNLCNASQGDICESCTANCTNKYCGDSNGCGGMCTGLSAEMSAIAGLSCSSSGDLMCGNTPITVDVSQIDTCVDDDVSCSAVAGGCSATESCVAGICREATPCNAPSLATVECDSSSQYGKICGGGYLICKAGDSSCGNVNLVAAPGRCLGGSGALSTVCTCGSDNNYKTWGDGTLTGGSDTVYGLNNFSDGADGTTVKSNSTAFPAAKHCLDLSLTVNGVTYDDWYLPSAKELAAVAKSSEEFYLQYQDDQINPVPQNVWAINAYYGEALSVATLASGAHYDKIPLLSAGDVHSYDYSRADNLGIVEYWSSTETNSTDWNMSVPNGAYAQRTNGYALGQWKTTSRPVRCVRRF